MRALKYFAIALTPFILNADLVQVPEIQERPLLLNTEHPKPLSEEPLPTSVERTPIVTKQDEPAPAPVQQAPVVTTTSSECLSPLRVMHVDVRHTEAKGVGYKDGYTTLEGFGIYDHCSYFMPFLDLRGHVFNDGKLAGNVGLGERTYIPSINHIFSLYCYYDVRQEEHDLTVNQISPGLEILGKRMEYRINGYFPVGRNESHSYSRKFSKFEDHSIFIQKKKKYAMTGGDMEVGAHITQSTNHDVYAGLGPYYFTADPFSAWGGKARLLWRYKEYISLEASYSYDHLFKNIFQGTVGFSYPFGKKLNRQGKNCPNSNDLALSRAAFAPYRFEIPVVRRHTQHKKAINPATQEPWRVWFVDNTSHSAGTYESPFPTLAEAQNASGPNDMIYVFSGDGTTRGMNTGIVLQNGQTLFGAGNSHKIDTTKGPIRIRAFSSLAPSLTNAGSIITLANGNEVSGMNLLVTQSGSRGIDGSFGIIGANINHNVISGNVDHTGILVEGSGTFNVTRNRLNGTTNGTTNGIFVGIPNNSLANITVSNNICSGYNVCISVGPHSNPTTASGNITVSGNMLSDFNTSGINYGTGMINAVYRITNNTILNNVGAGGSSAIGLGLNLSPNSGSVFIDNNTIMTTTTQVNVNGIFGQIFTITDGVFARISITNNRIQTGSGNGSAGIKLLTNATDTMCATLTNNQVQLQAATGTNGLSIAASTGAINIDDFSNNIFPDSSITGNVTIVAPHTCGP